MPDHPPFIVTAALDEGAFAWFEDLLQSHFPGHRNQVPAHLTLFHALPGAHERAVAQTLQAAYRSRRPLRLSLTGPWSLGRGVAYRLASPDLDRLRGDLAHAFSPCLTRQDQAGFDPTSQPQQGGRGGGLPAFRVAAEEFEPFLIFAEGLLLSRYHGGPWAMVDQSNFEAP